MLKDEKTTNQKYWQRLPKDTLTIKIIGTFSQIENFTKLLKRIYRSENLIFSPIKKSLEDAKFHCYANILPPNPSLKKEAELRDAKISLWKKGVG